MLEYENFFGKNNYKVEFLCVLIIENKIYEAYPQIN